jgi:NAD(P)-dependent dehydrogenase (short-subunit alcohol dehydrogenase family)
MFNNVFVLEEIIKASVRQTVVFADNFYVLLSGLWAVVNNAGLNAFGYVEWVPIGVCKKVMDVNVWGAVRVIRAFLPLLRDTKGSSLSCCSVL